MQDCRLRPGKVAKLDRGVTINVPVFTKNGESIRVKIENRRYRGKEHGSLTCSRSQMWDMDRALRDRGLTDARDL